MSKLTGKTVSSLIKFGIENRPVRNKIFHNLIDHNSGVLSPQHLYYMSQQGDHELDKKIVSHPTLHNYHEGMDMHYRNSLLDFHAKHGATGEIKNIAKERLETKK